MYTENDYLMWLSCIINLGVDKRNQLLDYFGSAEDIWKSDRDEISKVINVKENVLHTIIRTKTNELMEKRLSLLREKNIQFVGVSDILYPDKLRVIHQPPVGIYVIGSIPDFTFPSVAIVGTRKCSVYGKDIAYLFARELSQNNVIIVSGMAEGIDSAAHRGALAEDNVTVAVFGNGVDICYPAFNKELKEKIIQNGCVISEYPPGMAPKPYHFPARNRIISGLSDAAVIIEGSEKSGSLITANHALEQGRDVFAVPGDITQKRSDGPNKLLKQGAYVLTQTSDILEVLRIEPEQNNKINNKNITQALATDEKLLYDCMGENPISVDELFIKTQMELNNLQCVLTMLEIKGFIQKVSGQRYMKV